MFPYRHEIASAVIRVLSKVGYGVGVGLEKNTPTLSKELERRAVASSADYVEQHMQNAIMFLTHTELLRHSVNRGTIDGEYLEFGVYKGNTINYIAKLVRTRAPSKTVWGFDSFEGLPNDWGGYVITKETFDQGGTLPPVAPNVKLVKGFFDATLPGWTKNNLSPESKISLLHVDSDLYESCQTILNELNAHICPGTFILFDEYFNYPHWQNHEFKSFAEFCRAYDVTYRYVGFHEQKVLVEILEKK